MINFKSTTRTAASRAQAGFTLVELLVALALGLFVLIGLTSVFIAVKQSFRFQETSGRLQEDAAFALDTISRDLRMAGQAGCLGISKITTGSGPTAVSTYFPGSVIGTGYANGLNLANPLSQVLTSEAEVTTQPMTAYNFVRGFDGIPAAMFPSSPPSNTTTDSLFFMGASSKAVALSSPMTVANSALTIATDTFNWRSASNNTRTFIISNCASSSVFVGLTSAAGTGAQIAHGTAQGNSVDTFTSSTVFGTDTVVMPLEWSFYYVATRAGADTPSLYRIFFNGSNRSNAEEIVSNVESMQVHYGESNLDATSGLSTLKADIWRTSPTAVSDWSRVVAVRVGLMLVSSLDNANPGVTIGTPTLLGATYALPSGASANRLRKEFSTTVVLRNAVAAR
jgi:type IV pilus assembly protein PilW